MDLISKSMRSRNMSAIRSKNTKPELIVRKLLYSLGYRFRINRLDLPGKPDILIPKYKTAIFVHGCFWHQHKGCKRKFMPKSNLDYWKPKLEKNVKRFGEQELNLKEEGIKVLVIWECQTNDIISLKNKLNSQICEAF